MTITAAEFERSRTWILEIAAAVLPGTAWQDVGEERAFASTGGLSINRRNGLWFCHAAGRGGCSPIELVRFVKDWSMADASAWVLAFLGSHPGTGAATDSTEDGDGDAAAEARRIKAEATIAATLPVEGTPAEAYLRSRGLVPPYHGCVGFVPDARVGEGALVGRLEEHGRVVGVQLTHLDPDGRKSLALPLRRRSNLEKSPGAGFIIPASTNPQPGPPVTLICEGLEDAMSLALTETGQVIGLPGVGGMRHLELPNGADVVVFRDGDPTGSSADKALITGIDHLLLAGAVVRVTATPSGEDANTILQSGGIEALRQLIADASPAELSLDGDIQRIARLDAAEYECERLAAAKKHRVRLGFVDDTASMYRRQAAAQTTAQAAPDTEDEPWDGPVPVLLDVLDAALKETSRYIVASKTKLASAVLWAAHTHLVHNERVGLQISPRLAIQANTWGSGKTTFLEIVIVMSFRGTIKSSVTASSFMRTMNVTRRTYGLDEGDRQITERAPEALILILNSGHRRSTSLVECSVPTPDGGWKVQEFDTWGAVAIASIGELPSTLQDRSVRILLQKATGEEVPEHLRDGTSPELVTIRRQLSAWADELRELPEPALPEILMRQAGRVGDNWRPLVAIADLAGGQWPELARQAALEEVAAEKQQTQMERLLAAIQRAFNNQSATLSNDAPDNRDRLRTTTLISALLADQEDDWGVANRGRIITAAWLRERLRGLLVPAGAQQWYTAAGPARVHCRGYQRLQFADSWRRYAQEQDPQRRPSSAPHSELGTPMTPGTHEADPQTSAGYEAEAAEPGAHAGDRTRFSNNTQKTQEFREAEPGEPGEMGGPGNIQMRAPRTTKKTNENATKGSASYLPDDEVEDAGETSLANLIRVARAANPRRSIKWLAKHVGQPVDIVEIYLGDGSL
jgi:Protein of unknown function (DUF3631)/Toprim domain